MDGVKGSGEDRGTNQSTFYDVLGGCSGCGTIWELNVGGYGCNDEGARDISSQDR